MVCGFSLFLWAVPAPQKILSSAVDDVPQFHGQLRIKPLQDIHFHVGAEFIFKNIVGDTQVVVGIGMI